MIRVRLPEGEFWLEPDQLEDWIRGGRIGGETWVWTEETGRWHRAAELEIFRRLRPEAADRPEAAGSDLEPVLEVIPGKAAAEPAPGFGQWVFPRKGFSVTESLVLFNVLVTFVMVLAWGREFPQELRELTRGWFQGVEAGRYYLFIPTIFIHANGIHLAMNMVSLLATSSACEYALGRRSTLLAYVITGLGGAVLSYAVRRGPVLSVGASGAIFGLVGVLAVFLARYYRHFPERQKWKTRRIYFPLMVLLFLPSLFHADAWAHLGGLGTGLVLGFVLGPSRHVRQALLPPGRRAGNLDVIE
jgi:rhomboid protease GluP